MSIKVFKPILKAFESNLLCSAYGSSKAKSIDLTLNKLTTDSLCLSTRKSSTELLSAIEVNRTESFWNKILNLFGIRKRLRPDSFVNINNVRPNKIYTITTQEGAKMSQMYRQSGVLYYDKKIPNGFRDAGRDASLDSNGKVIKSVREIITVDRELDTYLTNAINYAKKHTKYMNEEQKVKFLYNMILDICGDAAKSTKKSDLIAAQFCNSEILLGDVFTKEATCCRHKSLMFKILAEEIGLNAKMIRGDMVDSFGSGGHVWNEVKLQNGKKYLIDTQNSSLIDLISPSKRNKEYLKQYYYNNHRVY